ncbi:MAG TPA: TetR/AcrR family transcriptional regulator [Enterococcus columbae]|nr:TetR/AcrR family transcriptional regulator [Enterococcus columbae]
MNGFEKRTFAKKEQLLQAVLEIINHPSGIKVLTIQKLVDTTHISRATIFKYYASKDQLLKQAFIYYLDQMNQQALEILAQKKRLYLDLSSTYPVKNHGYSST